MGEVVTNSQDNPNINGIKEPCSEEDPSIDIKSQDESNFNEILTKKSSEDSVDSSSKETDKDSKTNDGDDDDDDDDPEEGVVNDDNDDDEDDDGGDNSRQPNIDKKENEISNGPSSIDGSTKLSTTNDDSNSKANNNESSDIKINSVDDTNEDSQKSIIENVNTGKKELNSEQNKMETDDGDDEDGDDEDVDGDEEEPQVISGNDIENNENVEENDGDDNDENEDEDCDDDVENNTGEDHDENNQINIPVEEVAEVVEDETYDSDLNLHEKNPLDTTEDDPTTMTIDDENNKNHVPTFSGSGGGSGGVGGDSNNSMDDNDVQHIPIVEEVHAISDSEDEDHQLKLQNNKTQSNNVERMEIEKQTKDSSKKENGHKNNENDDDDDLPVVIQSDSESDEEDNRRKSLNRNTTSAEITKTNVTPKNNGNSSASEVHEILSDKEDCVVIEEDDNDNVSNSGGGTTKKEDDKDILSPRRSSRARKSVVKIRDFSAFDDDIEEVVEDPLSSQPAAKKQKTNSPPSLGITIQDARSLVTDPLMHSSTNASFQQQFIQSSQDGGSGGGSGSGGGNLRKKEPTLVIIDTNQIMARGGAAATVQALQNQHNLSVHAVHGGNNQNNNNNNNNHQNYSTNMRGGTTSITPILQKSPQNKSLLPSTNNAPLLPALTDDMFVLEAPSFIVPYIYEKPPTDNLKDIVEQIGINLTEQRKKNDRELAENEAKEIAGLPDEQRQAIELAKAVEGERKKKKAPRKRAKNGDESWDESDTSTDDESSDTEQQRTKILIKEVDEDLVDSIKAHIITPTNATTSTTASATNDLTAAGGAGGIAGGIKRDSYFESPLGKFFMDIGINLVQEHVQTDLLRQQKKKIARDGDSGTPASIQLAINSLKKNLEHSKQKNEIFKFETKRCEFCNFKSESVLSMAHHYETPHMNGQMHKCNFCSFETRPPYDILFHMEAMHNIKARLEKGISYHQCPNCPFEDNGKSKLARHALVCAKKYRPDLNLNPPLDWEPPAKIPRIKPRHGLVGTATAYQAMAAQAQRAASGAAALQRQNAANAAMMRGRGRPQNIQQKPITGTVLRTNQQIISRQPQMSGMGMPNNFQLGNSGQYIQVTGAGLALLPNNQNAYIMQSSGMTQKGNLNKSQQQPSISITPLPRQTTTTNTNTPSAAVLSAATTSQMKSPNISNMKPGQSPVAGGGKASFVICEICDGYIKDLDQLRNHMQWMHKVKIHPKMIYNRPPLNCQKCQFRFFTDQGLERHLLGSHGLVTSSMQEAANKGKDAGRCPVCGRMYQWKLLNHVSRDHNMTLKPAHLSYKCTVCTATFGMYKQFENHVYSAHSTVAKKAMETKNKNITASSSSKMNNTDSLLKPLKMSDEITIIPQPSQRQSRSGGGGGSSSGGGGGSSSGLSGNDNVIEIL